MQLDPDTLLAGLPDEMRRALFDEFEKLSRNYRERRWEPSELSGGRFCEVVYTILNGYPTSTYPSKPKKPRNFPQACNDLESGPSTLPHSMRILIPRVLPGMYDVRNNRNVGHVGGDVDPNHMDATLVFNTARWILGELIRVFHDSTIEDATLAVEALTEKVVPAVWDVPSGHRRVLSPGLSMKNKMLLVLYAGYPQPIAEQDLVAAIEHSNASVFRRDVLRRAHKDALVHYDSENRLVFLSPVGVRAVEERIPLEI